MPKSSTPLFVVGQRVFVEQAGRRGFGEHAQTSYRTILAVGRSKATCDGDLSFDMATGRIDGQNFGFGPRRVHRDAAAWEAEVNRAAMLLEFVKRTEAIR